MINNNLNFSQYLDTLCENGDFVEALEDKDIEKILRILNGDEDKKLSLDSCLKKNLNTYNSTINFIFSILNEFITENNIERYQKSLGSILYLYFCSKLGLDEVELDGYNSIYSTLPYLNHLGLTELQEALESIDSQFSTIYFTNNKNKDDVNHFEFIRASRIIILPGDLEAADEIITFGSCSELVIDSCIGAVQLKNIDQLRAVFYEINSVIKTNIAGKEVLTLPALISKGVKVNTLKTIDLISLDSITEPLYIGSSFKFFPSVKIEKKKETKLLINSINRYWFKEHVVNV
jgi:hypothetical protein